MQDDTLVTGNTDAPTEAVDTAPTQSNEADVQVENEAPEATQATEAAQEATSTEVKAEDTAEERLLAGKYKSVEDLEKSYTELQSKATRDAQEKAELARILNETFATPEAPAQQLDATDTDSYGEYEESNPMTKEFEAIKRKDAVRDFIFLHPDADGAVVNKVLQEDPIVANITGYEAKLEYAYLKSKSINTADAVAQAKKDSAIETKQKIVEKQTAQVETAQKAEVVDDDADLQERMQSGSLSEREAARREYIRKFLV